VRLTLLAIRALRLILSVRFRDDLERDARRVQGERLFPSPPEDERIAPFEPDDRSSGASEADEQVGDLGLRRRRSAGGLATLLRRAPAPMRSRISGATRRS
jgi:hypothetical protein